MPRKNQTSLTSVINTPYKYINYLGLLRNAHSEVSNGYRMGIEWAIEWNHMIFSISETVKVTMTATITKIITNNNSNNNNQQQQQQQTTTNSNSNNSNQQETIPTTNNTIVVVYFVVVAAVVSVSSVIVLFLL